MAWTFTVGATVAAFAEQKRETIAEWDDQPVVDVARGIGSNESDVSSDGNTAPTIEIAVQVETVADHLALKSFKGQTGTLSDGTDSWTAMLSYYLAPRVPFMDLRRGTARFIRSS